MDKLFVHGTFAPGKPNHNALKEIPGHWETATLRGNLLDEGWGAELGCPGILPSDHGDEVQGFVFSSGYLSEHWAVLDEYEGDGYKRLAVLVKAESADMIEA